MKASLPVLLRAPFLRLRVRPPDTLLPSPSKSDLRNQLVVMGVLVVRAE